MQSMGGVLSTTPCTALTFLAILRLRARTTKNEGPVITYARQLLDDCVPLESPWLAATALRATPSSSPTKMGTKSTQPRLLSAGPAAPTPSGIVVAHHNLHVHIVIDHEHSVGATDSAGIADVRLESAIPSLWIAKTPSHALMQKIRRLPIGTGLAFNARPSPRTSQRRLNL